jgi:threonine/homoserine/homoserine lactone efflux protein
MPAPQRGLPDGPGMLKHLVLGGGLGLAAGLQPGPMLAFLLARAVTVGWKRTLPACLAPLLSDGPIALVSLLLLSQMPPSFQAVLQATGGVLLLYFAGTGYREWRRPDGPASGGSIPRTLLQASLVNFLNPNPYLAWSLVIGPTVVTAWRESAVHAFAFVGALYGTMCATMAGVVLVVGTSGLLGPRARRALVLVAAALLAGLGLFLLVGSASRLGS